MTRRFWVWLHRWVGLAMAVFLIVVGLTGSLLAFFGELNRTLTPHLFPPAQTGTPLDLATLAERAEALVPQARVNSVYVGEPGTALVRMEPRSSSATGKPVALGFNQLFLDPVNGGELGRRQIGGLPSGWDNFMPFVYRLHYNLSLDKFGMWVLGITALLWTIDCFVSFYLTLPAMARKREAGEITPQAGNTVGGRSFLSRWKPSWLVKWQSSTFRINFDFHRAGGLWLWAALLVFAWSSVYMNLHDSVYAPATRLVLDYPMRYRELPELDKPLEYPVLGWRQALGNAERLLAEQGRRHSFTVERPVSLRLDRMRGMYVYTVRSSRDIQDRRGRTAIAFDAGSGELKDLQLPSGQHNGITVTMWLNALHDANVFGMPYRIFVCILGLAITMLSATGVYIWWKKCRARSLNRQRRSSLVNKRV